MLRSLSREPSVRALRDSLKEFSDEGALANRDIKARVALSVTTGRSFTLDFARGACTVREGRCGVADTTIISDPLTLIGIIRGRRSGIEAFLRGRLGVRGNLALALSLDSLFDRGDVSVRRAHCHHAKAAGVDTSYLEAGKGSPVVLLHGLGSSNSSMLTTLWDLSRDHRVLAPDIPGFGDSAKPVGRLDAAFFARWLTGFLDAAGVDTVHVVGNSMGGRIAIELALRSPDRVDRLALLAPSMAFRKYRHFERVVRTLSPAWGKLPVPTFRLQVERTIRSLFARPERIRPTWYAAAVDEFQRVFGSARGRVAFFSAAREIYLERPFGDDGFWTRMRGLSRPSLFLWGRHDWLVPAKFSRHVTAALPSSSSRVLDDCGHIPQFELPCVTHPLVRSFLDEKSRVISFPHDAVPAHGPMAS